MQFVLVTGTTETARISEISAAGKPDERLHTPGADAEIVSYGRTVRTPVVPVSPAGCPTPAVITRAVHELLGLDLLILDAGLAGPTAAPTVGMDAAPGNDIRGGDAVPNAEKLYERARAFGASLPDEQLFVGESIPAGTTTALAVLRALGEPASVSSSLSENPLDLKYRVTDEALAAGGLASGEAAGNPLYAVRTVGDPVLVTIAGLLAGCAESGTDVTLAGGTQLAAAAALARHAGVETPLTLATTSYVAEDETAGTADLAGAFDLSLTVTDPEFDRRDHPAMAAYEGGVAKEGVGMGGALALADGAGISTATLHDRIETVYDRVTSEVSR